jgi:hypothetical protein
VSFEKAEPRLRHVSAECPRQRVLRKSYYSPNKQQLHVCVSANRTVPVIDTSSFVAIQKTEPWENEKCEADMEKYVWEGSQSQRTLEQLLKRMPDREKAQDLPEVIEQYSKSVTHFHNEGSYLFFFNFKNLNSLSQSHLTLFSYLFQ